MTPKYIWRILFLKQIRPPFTSVPSSKQSDRQTDCYHYDQEATIWLQHDVLVCSYVVIYGCKRQHKAWKSVKSLKIPLQIFHSLNSECPTHSKILHFQKHQFDLNRCSWFFHFHIFIFSMQIQNFTWSWLDDILEISNFLNFKSHMFLFHFWLVRSVF